MARTLLPGDSARSYDSNGQFASPMTTPLPTATRAIGGAPAAAYTPAKPSSGKKLAAKSRPFWEIQEERRLRKEMEARDQHLLSA